MTGSGKIQKFKLKDLSLKLCAEQGIEIILKKRPGILLSQEQIPGRNFIDKLLALFLYNLHQQCLAV